MSANNTAKTVIVIPARYGSVRFPGKVLAELGGKPIIQWVYERAMATSADAVIVATDSERVLDVVTSFGGAGVMTSPDCPSGTDRVWQAAKDTGADIIINVQGDEPFIDIDTVNRLINALREDSNVGMATAAAVVPYDEIATNPNAVKAVLDSRGFALYFSRSTVPFPRDGASEGMTLYRHWGIYGFRRDTLQRFVALPEGKLERIEKLEQLRALENGIAIRVLVVDREMGVGIDTPDDLAAAERYLRDTNASAQQ